MIAYCAVDQMHWFPSFSLSFSFFRYFFDFFIRVSWHIGYLKEKKIMKAQTYKSNFITFVYKNYHSFVLG